MGEALVAYLRDGRPAAAGCRTLFLRVRAPMGAPGTRGVADVVGLAGRRSVTAGYAGRAWELARRAGSDFVFRPGPADRGYKNFVANFTQGLAADPAAPRLSLRRARSAFICGHLAAVTPLGELLAITGICQAESLARYARHVEGAPSKAVLRAWDNRRH